MQITCASCKSGYSLTVEQIRGLPHSILPCSTCGKLIKITTCPSCQSYYSITFSTAQHARYGLTCERCARPFTIEFPMVREPRQADESGREPASYQPPAAQRQEREDRPTNTRESARSSIAGVRHAKPSLFNRLRNNAHAAPARDRRHEGMPATVPGGPVANGVHLTLSDLFSICATGFTVSKLVAGSIGIFVSFLLVRGFGWIISGLLDSAGPLESGYFKSVLSLVPFALVFIMYIMSAAVISRITMESAGAVSQAPAAGVFQFTSRAIVPVFIANIALFLVIDLVLVLFGKIPIVGPVIFALLFLPIYAASICIILIVAVGFWFYPPVIAAHNGSITSFGGMFRFIRRQNVRLTYTVPLMAIITAVVFAGIYLLHYGSLSLSMLLAKGILAEEGEKIFSAVPPSFLSISDLAIKGSDAGLFRSLMGSLIPSHTIGGFIIGIIFSLISILLFASFISISATLSTRLYLMMERGGDIDDRSKLRVLILLVLILLGVFLVKKIFF